MEGRVPVEGRAEVAQPGVRLAGSRARAGPAARRDLPMPGSPDEQHDLALAVAGLAPAVEQQAELVLAPDQRRQVLARAEPRTGSRSRWPPTTRKAAIGSAKPGSLLRAEVGEVEQPAEQASRAVGDHHAFPARRAPAGGRRGSASRRPPPPPARRPRRPGRRPRRARSRCRPVPPAARPPGRLSRATAAVDREAGADRPLRPRPRAPWASRNRPARRRP